MANGAPVDPQLAIDAANAAQAQLNAAAAQAQAILDQAVLDAAAAHAAAQAQAAQAAGAPPPAAGAPPIVAKTWDTLVAEANIEPHTIAHQLIQETQSVPWEEAMGPFTRFLGVIKGPPVYSAETGQWLYVDDLAKNYYLTVMDNKWEVIFGYGAAPRFMQTEVVLRVYAAIVV
jgi:hypothetical protein